MSTQQKATRYHTLSRDIAHELNATWTPAPIPADQSRLEYVRRHQELTTAASRKIILSFDGWGNENRIAIFGRYPCYQSGQTIQLRRPPTTITVSQDRTAASIAADIKRRFLPDFNKYWEDCLALKAKDDVAIQRTRLIAEMLITHAGCTPGIHNRDWQTPDQIKTAAIIMGHPKAYRIQVYAGTVQIERIASIDPETAVNVLLALGKSGKVI